MKVSRTGDVVAPGSLTIGSLVASGDCVDFQHGGLTMVIGADTAAMTRTNATTKYGRIGQYHYTNAEEPTALIVGQSTATNNTIYIGGGSSSMNSATLVRIYTAANQTTTTGTSRFEIDASGNVNITGGTFATKGNGGDLQTWADSGGVGKAQMVSTGRLQLYDKFSVAGNIAGSEMVSIGSFAGVNTLVLYDTGPSPVFWVGETGNFFAKDVYNSTNGTANVNVTSDGRIRRIASSIKTKTSILDITDEQSETIYKLKPITYKQKINDAGHEDDIYPGLIAEWTDEVQPLLVEYDNNNDPSSIRYDRLSIFLLKEIQKMRLEINEIKRPKNGKKDK